MSDPVKCFFLGGPPHHNGLIAIDKSIYEEPDPGQAFKARLHDCFSLGYGDTYKDAMISLAESIEQTAAEIRRIAGEAE